MPSQQMFTLSKLVTLTDHSIAPIYTITSRYLFVRFQTNPKNK